MWHSIEPGRQNQKTALISNVCVITDFFFSNGRGFSHMSSSKWEGREGSGKEGRKEL